MCRWSGLASPHEQGMCYDHDLNSVAPVLMLALLSVHIRDEMRHGISDTPESLPAALPRVDPQDRLQNGLSCACFMDSGHFQGMLMQLVPS